MLIPPAPPHPIDRPRPSRRTVTFGAACQGCDSGHLEDDDPEALRDRVTEHLLDCSGPTSWCCRCTACGWDESRGCNLTLVVMAAETHRCQADGVNLLALPVAA